MTADTKITEEAAEAFAAIFYPKPLRMIRKEHTQGVGQSVTTGTGELWWGNRGGNARFDCGENLETKVSLSFYPHIISEDRVVEEWRMIGAKICDGEETAIACEEMKREQFLAPDSDSLNKWCENAATYDLLPPDGIEQARYHIDLFMRQYVKPENFEHYLTGPQRLRRLNEAHQTVSAVAKELEDMPQTARNNGANRVETILALQNAAYSLYSFYLATVRPNAVKVAEPNAGERLKTLSPTDDNWEAIEKDKTLVCEHSYAEQEKIIRNGETFECYTIDEHLEQDPKDYPHKGRNLKTYYYVKHPKEWAVEDWDIVGRRSYLKSEQMPEGVPSSRNAATAM